MFTFYPFPHLQNDEIELVLHQRHPADPFAGYVPSYDFSIRLRPLNLPIGLISVRIGHNHNTYLGGNIGYHIDAPYRGHHYAAQACELAKEVGRRHHMSYFIITCNPENAASRRTIERVGGRFLECALLPEDNEMYQAGEHHKMIYRVELDNRNQ